MKYVIIFIAGVMIAPHIPPNFKQDILLNISTALQFLANFVKSFV